jgi:hypothetical protein
MEANFVGHLETPIPYLGSHSGWFFLIAGNNRLPAQ